MEDPSVGGDNRREGSETEISDRDRVRPLDDAGQGETTARPACSSLAAQR
jgi:hypothetical protein